MAKVASKPKKWPGLTRRMTRSTVWAGVLAAAVTVGRKTAGGAKDGKARDGQGTQAAGSDGSHGTRRGRRRRPVGRPPDRPAGGR